MDICLTPMDLDLYFVYISSFIIINLKNYPILMAIKVIDLKEHVIFVINLDIENSNVERKPEIMQSSTQMIVTASVMITDVILIIIEVVAIMFDLLVVQISFPITIIMLVGERSLVVTIDLVIVREQILIITPVVM